MLSKSQKFPSYLTKYPLPERVRVGTLLKQTATTLMPGGRVSFGAARGFRGRGRGGRGVYPSSDQTRGAASNPTPSTSQAGQSFNPRGQGFWGKGSGETAVKVSQLPHSFNAGNIKFHLAEWQKITKDIFTLSCVQEVKLEFLDCPVQDKIARFNTESRLALQVATPLE